MSEPSFHAAARQRAGAVALLLLGLGSTAAAQSVEAYRARVERLEERLARIGREGAPSGDGDSVPADLDTLSVGPIRLLAPARGRSFVQAVADGLRDSLDIVVGGDTSYLPGLTYLVRPRGPEARARAWRPEGGRVWWYTGGGPPGRAADTPDEVASGLLGLLRMDVLVALGPPVRRWLGHSSATQEWPVRRWLGHSWVALDTLTHTQAGTVYLELATTPWSAVAACYLGRLDRCRIALALEGTGPETWYTPEERRQMVTSAMPSYGAMQRDLAAQRCVNTGDEQACRQTLADYPALVTEPLSPMARQTLVRVAFEAGGTGAFRRLMRSESMALSDRLAYTAGLSIDSLVARWRDEILAAKPPGAILTRVGGWTAFLWVVVLSVIAMRSTRWRIR